MIKQPKPFILPSYQTNNFSIPLTKINAVKKLLNGVLSLLVTCVTFAQVDTTHYSPFFEYEPPKITELEKTKTETMCGILMDCEYELPKNTKSTKLAKDILIIECGLDYSSAEFLGGRKELIKFLSDNINLPPVVAKDSLSSKSIVRFVIDTNGYVSSITVVKPMTGCPECDEEVIRVIKMMPKWHPARKNGKFIPHYFTLPIEFKSKP